MPVLQAVEALNGIFDTCVRSGDYAAPFTRSEYRTMQLISMFLVLFFFLTSLCFFILYFCKSSFNLSIFLRYFLVPRGMAARLYSLKISREAVINCLNISSILFTASNLVFAASFMKQEERKNAEGSAPRRQPFSFWNTSFAALEFISAPIRSSIRPT